jgi:hypothetical protein
MNKREIFVPSEPDVKSSPFISLEDTHDIFIQNIAGVVVKTSKKCSLFGRMYEV